LPERVSSLCDVTCGALGAILGGVGIWIIGKHLQTTNSAKHSADFTEKCN
jgi:hypothetical protein